MNRPSRHFFLSNRSSTKQPRTCGPGPRRWSRITASAPSVLKGGSEDSELHDPARNAFRGSPGLVQLLRRRVSLKKPLRDFNLLPASLLIQPAPDVVDADAGASEQPPLAVAPLSLQQ